MDIIKLIDDAITERANDKPHRDYLGASSLGETCDAKLWYGYKHPKKILDPRINRIFDMGNMLEEYLVNLLRRAGLTLHTHDEDGKQFGFVDGIIAGSSDGVIELDTPHLIEFKSYNNSRFNALKKDGVKSTAPTYFTQVNIYMGELGLDKCLFMAINKDNCEIYTEYIDYDPFEHNWAVNRGKELALYTSRPDRKYNHVSHFMCKLCSWKKECWSEN